MTERSPLFSSLDAFRTPDAPRLLTRSIYGSALGLTEVSGPAGHGITATIPNSRAYLLQLRLRDCPGATYFLDGRALDVSDHTAGAIQFHDLRSDPRVELSDPFHVMHINVPLATLDGIVDELGIPRIDELTAQPGHCYRDTVIENLLRAMRPALARPGEVSALFLEHLSTAACLHLVQHYVGISGRGRQIRGGLAHWQERLAKDMLRADLGRDLSLLELAQACGISVRHFTRAFKQSTGMPAHQFRQRCRLDHARNLLKANYLPIGEIAVLCGFASQSHFSRCFHRFTGQTPANWRAINCSATLHGYAGH
ncbi:MAG: AraC family transcriptional regulator [Pseudomonadota bacterium]